MSDRRTAPYGSWLSPITSDTIVRGTIRLGQIALDGEDAYWVERRPTEGGRNVVVRRSADGQQADMTPAGFNARSRVHEYGGGDLAVDSGILFFCNDADQRIYRQVPGSEPEPVTPPSAMRYADLVVDRRRNRLLAVREDHSLPGCQPVNTLVSIDLGHENTGTILASGHDFYASPRLSPDGNRLAWLTWNHPNMPWDGCELWAGQLLPDGTLGASWLVAGGPEESVFQPEWSPDGVLYFVSERSGWWNLYRSEGGRAEALCPMEAEFGTPQWVFGISLYAFESPQRIVCTYRRQGVSCLATIDTRTGALEPIENPYTDIRHLCCAPGRVLLRAGAPSQAPAVVALDLATRRTTVLRCSGNVDVDDGYISLPQAIEFPTENGLTAYAFYYAPKNRDYAAPSDELPPLLVMSHAGPTGSASTTLDLETQYWTSRGIAVLDVNYGGSSGYGRAYRRRLNGQWGIVDVDDCVNGARYLAQRGLVDVKRLAITGGSAGGYTTLCALTFRDQFKAGASYYGIGDLEAMARDTHKFESRYLDRLIGPYPARRDLYYQRSPIHFTEQLSCPVIFFQGLEDKIVPPNQAEAMASALRGKGLPVAYLTFAGEQHGFRRAETIKRALDAELFFYSRIFGFALAEPIEPVRIENLP